jgi:uncharacterized membrane protein YqaE (UPF0057 family)
VVIHLPAPRISGLIFLFPVLLKVVFALFFPPVAVLPVMGVRIHFFMVFIMMKTAKENPGEQ